MIKIEFVPSGRGKARCKPNPKYPNGKDIDMGLGGDWVDLPYPAPECGHWKISGPGIKTIGVTCAGRPDDPRRVRVPKK